MVDMLSQLNGSEKADPTSWWVWFGWLRRDAISGFVYGCAARNSRPSGWTEDRAIDLPGAGRLEVRQRTVTDAAFRVFKEELKGGSIKPEFLLSPGAPDAAIAATRVIVQDGLGQSAARVTTYYSLPDVPMLIGEADEALRALLSGLQAELNFPFATSYAARLGNFEIFDLHPWLDGPQPFLIENALPPGKDREGPEMLEVCRTPAFAHARHIAHIAGRVHGDVVIDRLVMLEPGELRVPVESPEWLNQLDFQIFSEDGETLLHSERNTYMTQTGFVLAPITRQMTIEDDLSRRAGSASGRAALTVHVHTSIRSQVGAPATGSWRKFARDMDDIVAARLPKPSDDRWFPRGIEGELGAIAHLNGLLSGGQISRAVLVDPWFGPEALRTLVLRLGSQDVHLTIVTGWARSHPDTREPLDAANNPTQELETTLRQIQMFLGPGLTVINLIDGTDQAFHDRYLLLYPHEGPSKVYLLSNSLNRAAGHWPFCMSLLAADVTLHVRRYIEGLCRGQDIARGKALTITFKWPADAS
jgi:hypothetical protein